MDHSGIRTPDRTENSATTACWRLDQANSRMEFRVPHFWGLWVVKGRFKRFDGWLDTDENGPRGIELTIDAASINTRNPVRDRHLRAADFFGVDKHPEVRFHATAVRTIVGSLRVDGELVAAGHSVSLALQPTFEQRGEELHIEAEVKIDQRRLGMTWSPLGMTHTPVTVRVRALMRPEKINPSGKTGPRQAP